MDDTMTELRIICNGRGSHAPVELVALSWTPASFETTGAAVWGPDGRARDMIMAVKGETTSPNGREDRARRVIHRAAVKVTTRSDGGKTVHVPDCPRCGVTGRAFTDEHLRHYFESVRDTPWAGTLNISSMI